eukprot:m.32592 g.32592  ORF g.32592 m.32592 type:complete len:125 (+) comp5551_c0_seq2:1794-2168(+)
MTCTVAPDAILRPIASLRLIFAAHSVLRIPSPERRVGLTPVREPLMERAAKLREACIQLMGDAKYREAHQILKTTESVRAEAALEAALGAPLLADVAGLLNQLLACEASLEAILAPPPPLQLDS